MYSRMALVLLRLGLQRLMQMATSRANPGAGNAPFAPPATCNGPEPAMKGRQPMAEFGMGAVASRGSGV